MENSKELKARSQKLAKRLKELYPDAYCALTYHSPLQLLIATILSAQCTDVRVNMVTPALFKKYKKAEDFASAKKSELEDLIKSTGFYKNKATSRTVKKIDTETVYIDSGWAKDISPYNLCFCSSTACWRNKLDILKPINKDAQLMQGKSYVK